jgi:hypothetical protein
MSDVKSRCVSTITLKPSRLIQPALAPDHLENEPKEDHGTENDHGLAKLESPKADNISLEAAIEQTPASSLRTVIKGLVKEQPAAKEF